MAGVRRSRGTRVPASSRPSATGRVSSKMASLVKLRMAKLSIHAMGHGMASPAAVMRSMRSLRRNIRGRLQAAVVEDEDDDGGEEAVDAEVVPAALFEPGAQPLEGDEAGEEGEERAEQA